MKISTRILSLLLITAMLLSLLTIIPTATQRNTTAEPCVNEAIEVSFNDLEDGDVIAIVMHTSPEMTDKDFVLLNNFGATPAANASEFIGTFDETMCWTVKIVDGQVCLYADGDVGLYAIDNNNGLRADGPAVPITMDASGYLSFTDPSGNVRYIGVYDNSGGDMSVISTPNFRCYKNYTNNTKNQTTTIYQIDGLPATVPTEEPTEEPTEPSETTDAYSGTCGDNVVWELDADTGILTISGIGSMKNYHYDFGEGYEEAPPWRGYTNFINTVKICDGVTSIGEGTFYGCYGLARVEIGDDVTSIGFCAFCECASLVSVTIPNSVTDIDAYAFGDCGSLASVSIPDSVTSIGHGAFSGCTSLTSISIPDSVTSIGGAAFSGCYSLTSVTIPEGVTSIGDSIFSDCDGLKSVTIPDSVTSIGSKAFYRCDSLTSIALPDSVISIGDSAFSECYRLTSISIPDSVTSIGYAAFSDCYNLTSVTIPDGITNIGAAAFGDCKSLTDITILNRSCDIGNYISTLGDPAKTTVYGYEGSTAQTYAEIYGYAFVALCEHPEMAAFEAVEPGCTAGNIAYWYCSDCDKFFSDADAKQEISYEQTLLPESHSFVDSICTVCGCGAPIVVEMNDSYGDGWNGNKILIYEDDVLIEELTISSGSSATASIDCYVCNDYRFVWQTGNYASECSFEIMRGDETLFSLSNASSLNSDDTFFEMTSHTGQMVTIEPTCTEDGVKSRTCSTCEESMTVVLPALGHSYSAVVTEPTCTTAGFTTHTCSRCADSYVDAQTEAFGHSYKFTDNGEDHTIICKDCDMVHLVGAHTYFDGICLCGALEPKKPTHDETLKFSMDISAGAEMVVNYNFMASIVSDYSDFYLEVRKDTADGEPVVTTYAIGDFDSMDHPVTGEALIYNATYSGISAKEMGDSFATTLYAVDTEGNIFYGETVTSSIKDFLIGKINDASSIPEMKTMAVDMLKYGAAAQIRFDYDSDNLVTNSLTAMQLAYGTEDIPEAENKCSESGSAANVTTNITVGSKVELSLSCICNDVTDPSNVKCLIMDEKNNVLARLDTTNKAGVMFSAKYDNVGAKEMRKVITATFYDGRNVISKTLKWSVESYVAQIRQTPGATAEEIALVNAMLTYGDSVAAYMTANGL